LLDVCSFAVILVTRRDLLSRSRIKNRKLLARSPRSINRLRACWAVQAPVG
jgi:hypothetical protein